eukprot:5489367-Amphidinium_carterae.1
MGNLPGKFTKKDTANRCTLLVEQGKLSLRVHLSATTHQIALLSCTTIPSEAKRTQTSKNAEEFPPLHTFVNELQLPVDAMQEDFTSNCALLLCFSPHPQSGINYSNKFSDK